MYVKLEPFGVCVYGERIGSTWLSLVESILKNGEESVDEGRRRISLQNIRIRSSYQYVTDPIIEKYANKKNIQKILDLTFKESEMYDFDVKPSFSRGSKSYYARIEEGKMMDYVVERLSLIPESKKAVMSFIHWDDYEAVLANPKDDYLPCVTTIQFRLLENDGSFKMNVVFTARSMDAYQKGVGNFIAIATISKKIAGRLEKNLIKKIDLGSLDGMITDAHIYTENIYDAQELLKKYKKHEENV
ncbi:MAG: thymidylate synthase [Patescibacteria group bacterium]